MSYELITTWGEHDSALEKVLTRATRALRIFDADLVKLRLERPESIEILGNFLGADINNQLRAIIRNAEPLRRNSPRLMKLLALHPQNMLIVECPEQIAKLSDSMLISDEQHALIRFHQDNVRSKIILDGAEECLPYLNRFEEIVKEGGEQVSATVLGL